MEAFAMLLKGNKKRKILHKNKFTNIVSKIKTIYCEDLMLQLQLLVVNINMNFL